MNYEQPRKRVEGSYWDWTTQNDDKIWRSGACAGDTLCKHLTEQEARDHQTEYLRHRLHNARTEELKPPSKPGDSLHHCQAYGQKCEKIATKLRDAGGYDRFTLCDEHFNDISWLTAGDLMYS